MALPVALLATLLPSVAAPAAGPLVAAIYFGDWHVDPQMSAVHGANWTEYQLPIHATPRFPGHEAWQPNIPQEVPGAFGLSSSEDQPEVMAKKIDAAVEHGVGMFVFDWYWYASPTKGGVPDLQGAGGGPFLDGALNKGFLKADNRDKMQFALMWANQDWVDVHPAKLGWHSTYRSSPEQPTFGPKAGKVAQLQMFDAFMSPTVYRNAFKYIAETYFTQPNYYKAPTKLGNGTTAQCCFFSFYQPQAIATGPTGEATAVSLMDDFRKAAEAVGQCLHLNHMGSPLPTSTIPGRGVASMTDYGWMKISSGDGSWPSTPYESVMEGALSKITANTEKYAALGVPYIPTISTCWDASPRTLPSDGWGKFGYPWGSSWHSNLSQWTTALTRSKADMLGRCDPAKEAWCPPLLINAWNEWSEGAYLEPDTRYQMGRLEAIKAVFPPHGGPSAAASTQQ